MKMYGQDVANENSGTDEFFFQRKTHGAYIILWQELRLSVRESGNIMLFFR